MSSLQSAHGNVAVALIILDIMALIDDETMKMHLMEQAFLVVQILAPPSLLLLISLQVFWVVLLWIRFGDLVIGGDATCR